MIDTKNSAYTKGLDWSKENPSAKLAQEGPGAKLQQEQGKIAGQPQPGGGGAADAPDKEQKPGLIAQSWADPTKAIDSKLAGGKINLKSSLDPKTLQENLAKKNEAWIQKRDAGSFAQFDQEGKLIRPEDQNLYAEEEAGLINPEAGLISPEAELGHEDEGLIADDDPLSGINNLMMNGSGGSSDPSMQADSRAPRSSAGAMTLEGMNSGGGSPPPRSAGGSAEG